MGRRDHAMDTRNRHFLANFEAERPNDGRESEDPDFSEHYHLLLLPYRMSVAAGRSSRVDFCQRRRVRGLIQDLDRPTSGFIKVSQQPMMDAAASIAARGE
jgi:hypothetical protein